MCLNSCLTSTVCDSRAAAGKFTGANGEVYEGGWKDNKKEGKGEESERQESTKGAEERRGWPNPEAGQTQRKRQ